jgi:hypothetical protein
MPCPYNDNNNDNNNNERLARKGKSQRAESPK